MIDDLIDDAGVTEISEKYLLRIEKYEKLIDRTRRLQLETNDKELDFIYSRSMYDMKRKLVNEKMKLKELGNF